MVTSQALSHSTVQSSNMLANKALTTAHGSLRSPRPDSPRPIACSTACSNTETVSDEIILSAVNVLPHHVARRQLMRNSDSLFSSLRYSLFKLSLGAVNRTDGNARLSRDRAHAQASR